jgi:hypothetical protein
VLYLQVCACLWPSTLLPNDGNHVFLLARRNEKPQKEKKRFYSHNTGNRTQGSSFKLSRQMEGTANERGVR